MSTQGCCQESNQKKSRGRRESIGKDQRKGRSPGEKEKRNYRNGWQTEKGGEGARNEQSLRGGKIKTANNLTLFDIAESNP